nr:unnamed protein product [Callosobruchus analis]
MNQDVQKKMKKWRNWYWNQNKKN